MENKTSKAVSLTAQLEALEAAITAAVVAAMPAPEDGQEAQPVEVEEIFDTYVVVQIGEAMFQADYSADEAGAVTLGELKPVEEQPAEETPEPEATEAAPMGDVVKAIQQADGSVKVAGYLVRYSTGSDPDLTGEFFDATTEFGDAKTSDGWFHHRDDIRTSDGVAPAYKSRLGKAQLTRDNVGVWAEMVLQARNEYEEMIKRMALDGKLGWSSGTAAHLIEREPIGKATHIKQWILGLDASLTPTPAEARNVASAIKSLTSQAETPVSVPGKNIQKGNIKMSIQEEFDRLYAERKAKEAEEAKASAARQAEIDAAVKAATAANDAQWAARFRLPTGTMQAPGVAQFADTNKYDHLSAADLGMAMDIQNELSIKSGKIGRAAPAALRALGLKVARIQEEHVSHDTEVYAKSAAIKALGGLSDDAIKAATDPAYTGLSNYGSDWMGTAYSNQLWEAVRAQDEVVGKIPTVVIPDGYSSEYFPLESTDPTWYKVAEVTAADSTMKIPVATVTNSQMGTATKQITVGKMGARAMYSGELTEDSIIAYVPELRRQMEVSGGEMMAHVVIDGDTATSSNINDIGGTTYSGAATTLFLLTNGFRKSPLVTTTANSRSAGGSLSENDYLETMWLMGTAGIGAFDLAKCAFIVDPNVYKKSLQLATLKTKDVWTQATMESGVLTKLWGYPVIPSFFMHYRSTARKANTAGKVDLDTTTNNLYGAILAVRWDQWKLAYKRRMTMETTRFANSDTWEIVALTRWGLGQRDTEASAETYYVGI